MVIDTSALLAILRDEPERQAFNACIAEAASRRLSAASLVESSIVIETRYGQPGVLALDRFLELAQVTVDVVDREQANLARTAYRRYGKGRHPAGLNLGDCFTYALAKRHAEKLLYKGDDFTRTDLEPACPDPTTSS
jgi:ribonuclease VapC